MEKINVELVKANILELYDFFANISGQRNKHYVEWCLRNKNILKIEKEIIDKTVEYTDEEKEYLQKEWLIIEEFAIRENDAVKTPIQVPKDKTEEFNTKLEELQKTEVKQYEAVLQKNKEKEQLLGEKQNVEVHTIKYEHIPDTIEAEMYIFLREREIIVD